LLDHVAAGDEKSFARSPYPGVELEAVGAALPAARSRVVGHDFYQPLGVGVPVICDNPAWQGGIDYLELDTPELTLKTWRRFGATHVLWPLQKELRTPEDLAGDAVFARAANAFSGSPFTVAGFRVAKLVRHKAPAVERGPTRIAWLGAGERALGVYTPAGLA